MRFKFQDALSEKGRDKDVEQFLSALTEKPEVEVIGAGRGPAGRVIHSLFAKQEVCLVTRCFCIRKLTRSLRSLVRFWIRHQLVRKDRAAGFFNRTEPCCSKAG